MGWAWPRHSIKARVPTYASVLTGVTVKAGAEVVLTGNAEEVEERPHLHITTLTRAM